MRLQPLESTEVLEQAVYWLARKENYQWLDFGAGKQIVTPALLKVMTQRDTHVVRIYEIDDDKPIGILGLNNVDRTAGSATLWCVTGENQYRNRGYATSACSRFLTLAFRELGLRTVNTWAVAVGGNPYSRVLERLNFRYYGRRRQCHLIDGRLHDRLYFDLLASEHREVSEGSEGAARGSRQGMSS